MRCEGDSSVPRQCTWQEAGVYALCKVVDKLLVCGIMAAQRQRLHTGTVAGAGPQRRTGAMG
jgi:hypothetical protein